MLEALCKKQLPPSPLWVCLVWNAAVLLSSQQTAERLQSNSLLIGRIKQAIFCCVQSSPGEASLAMKQHSRDGDAAAKTANKRLNIYFRCEAAHRARKRKWCGREKKIPSGSIHPRQYSFSISLLPLW